MAFQEARATILSRHKSPLGHVKARHCPLQVTQDWVSPFLPVSISLCSYPFPVICSLAKLCPTLQNPVDWSPPGSSLHGISKARMLECVAVFFSRRSSWTRDRTHVFCIGKQILHHWAIWEAHPSPRKGIQENESKEDEGRGGQLSIFSWCDHPARCPGELYLKGSFPCQRRTIHFSHMGTFVFKP